MLAAWIEERHVQTKVTGILSGAILSTRGMRACAPGASMCADGGLTPWNKKRLEDKNLLTYAIFTRTFSESNVHYIVMHVPGIFLG